MEKWLQQAIFKRQHCELKAKTRNVKVKIVNQTTTKTEASLNPTKNAPQTQRKTCTKNPWQETSRFEPSTKNPWQETPTIWNWPEDDSNWTK